MTACVSGFAAYISGAASRVPALYDGSWTEYAMRTPAEPSNAAKAK